MRELDLLLTLSAGSVIAEAMASGKPVIGTPIGSTSEMIVDGVTGWVMPLDPIESIADKIVQLVRNPEIYVQMGAAARKHAEAVFSIEKHVQKVQDVYLKLLSE
jgi:glycosyltransferase involved in cell wall biosynthesis